MTVEIEGVPYDWNQLRDFKTADHKLPENAGYDCGPECVAEVVYQITGGIEYAADDIKDAIKGDGFVGVTYSSDLSIWLSEHGFKNYAHQDLDADNTQRIITRAADRGCLSIVLLRFSIDDPESGHWVVATGYDDEQDAMICSDPWGGWRRLVPWHETAWFRGTVIEMLRRRCVDEIPDEEAA